MPTERWMHAAMTTNGASRILWRGVKGPNGDGSEAIQLASLPRIVTSSGRRRGSCWFLSVSLKVYRDCSLSRWLHLTVFRILNFTFFPTIMTEKWRQSTTRRPRLPVSLQTSEFLTIWKRLSAFGCFFFRRACAESTTFPNLISQTLTSCPAETATWWLVSEQAMLVTWSVEPVTSSNCHVANSWYSAKSKACMLPLSAVPASSDVKYMHLG